MTLGTSLGWHVGELNASLDQSLVDLGKVGQSLLLVLKLLTPLLNQISDPVLNLLVHFGVVEHSDELFEEGLASDLFVERCAAFVHEDVE